MDLIEAARTVAAYNSVTVRMAKDAVNTAFETTLSEGIRHERLLFQAALQRRFKKKDCAPSLPSAHRYSGIAERGAIRLIVPRDLVHELWENRFPRFVGPAAGDSGSSWAIIWHHSSLHERSEGLVPISIYRSQALSVVGARTAATLIVPAGW